MSIVVVAAPCASSSNSLSNLSLKSESDDPWEHLQIKQAACVGFKPRHYAQDNDGDDQDDGTAKRFEN